MKAYTIPLTLLSLLFPVIAFSQEGALRFSSVDSFAATVKYRGNLSSLTQELVTPYSTQLFKTRVIFKWITDNISYDCRDYNKHGYKGKEAKPFKCKDDEDCKAKVENWEREYIDRVVRKKKAVCQGYAMLFKRMCDIAGLKAEIIPGYTRSEYYQVGTSGALDHAWNSILIDSNYYLLDATWAAGGCAKDEDGKLLYFVKNFSEYYWLTPSSDFVRNHFPENPIWTLIPGYTKEKFAANPYYEPGKLEYLKLQTPNLGIINAKKGDTIRFKFDYMVDFKELQINSNIFRNPDIWVTEKISRRKTVRKLDTFAVKQQQYIPFRHEGHFYEFEYVVTDNALYYLDILCNKDRIMRFNVKVTE
jgi:Transglutaminase-like domain